MSVRAFRPRLPRGPWPLLVGAAVGALVVLAAFVPVPGFSTLPGASGTPPPTCQGNDSRVADPGAVHGMYVLDPPASPHGAYYADVARYLIPNPDVCGADLWVHWNSIDQGPNATPEYNFSKVDAQIAPWVAAGKVVNLIFWSVGYGPNSTYVPSDLLSKIGTIQCGGSAVTPIFWHTAFVDAYQAFVRASLNHFEHQSGVGYLRFGLGTGGEVFPLVDVNLPGCENRLNSTGFSIALWEHYLVSMLQFEASLHPTLPLMVGLNSVIPGANDSVSGVVSAAAAQYGFGIGSQGLQRSAVVIDPSTGAAVCNGGWCRYFGQFEGRIPLELQTIGPTDPNGSGPVGTLGPLLSYGIAEHAQVFELYINDWLTAFDPNYPGYPSYHAAYLTALDAGSNLLGQAPGG